MPELISAFFASDKKFSIAFSILLAVVGSILCSSAEGQVRYYQPRRQYPTRPQYPPSRFQQPANYPPYYRPQPNRWNAPNNGYYRPNGGVPLPKAPGGTAPARLTGPTYAPTPSPSPTPVTRTSPVRTAPVVDPKPATYNPLPRMIAEFEPQRAIMLSVSDLQSQHGSVLKQIVDQSHGHAEILILYNDKQQLKSTIELLQKEPTSNCDHVSFYRMELDTVWLRDFGPRISEDSSGIRALDFYYYGVRPSDDSFPERWTLETGGKMTKIPWTLQGGNLISNGAGMGLTTSKIFTDNQVSFPGQRGAGESKQFLLKEIKKFCNLKQLVVLEPLRNESTQHVDMFATLVAPDHVLVAELDPRDDRVNAKILDDNARKMAAVKVDGKSMRVSRIRIPNREGEAWSTYTNSIFTDRLVLVPTTKSDPPRLVRAAKAKYQQLFPDHHVTTVDITSMKKLQGSLHCMSLNLPAVAPLPDGTISFDKAIRIAERTPAPKPNSQTQPVTFLQRYPMYKQLRRIFKSSGSDFLLDAYAVGLTGDAITLLRVNDRKIIRVRVSAVCEADRYWIQRNAKKIQSSGQRVQRQVLSQRVN